MSEFSGVKRSTPVRTLIVDDSAFVRKVVRQMLSAHEAIEVVGTARDGEEALKMVEDLQPDVVICDLIMPRMNGVGFVRKQMQHRAVPILILTASSEDADQVLDAISAGAVDLVRKPTALASDELLRIREELVEKVLASAQAPMVNSWLAVPPKALVPPRKAGSVEIVVIGISTGGPQALRYLIPQLPADFPVPIAIVLHMPVGYTGLFAEKLNEISSLEVKEAQPGDLLKTGQVLLARAGHHLLLRRTVKGVMATLSLEPAGKLHRPSVDVLFRSAAAVYGSRMLGVIMTGMGDDGKEGAAWIKAQGGTVLTEAEESCVIYGMPRSVVEAGLSDAHYPLEKMAMGISMHL